ncbi:hypothetical protein CONPUDRAFT_166662 [Coniophora puteana RWD-64-598 SS2]|uniref:Uncharacterized protein n=1 Tax=Coniophora puteana (strain RWD-64-598) TaxID=741705 RepID=A0A5M3MMX3_CONPW|nr:uncharacterized protein CONPUDRAFT_166662 [Coniophora puteana RWD-64-598 SS2]EIW80055.1 hypothetical protein CONPUDRAFT_166662 [Coniophora puteana RWD-64-598 SS2]
MGSGLRTLLAADLIGVTISLSMYGPALAQAIYYWRTFPQDRLDQRLFVLTLLTLDTFHAYTIADLTGKSLIRCHRMSEEDWERCYTLITLQWTSKASLVALILIPTVVQLFYARRIYAMSGRNKWLTGIIVLLTAAGFAAATTGVVTHVHEFRICSIECSTRPTLRRRVPALEDFGDE